MYVSCLFRIKDFLLYGLLRYFKDQLMTLFFVKVRLENKYSTFLAAVSRMSHKGAKNQTKGNKNRIFI